MSSNLGWYQYMTTAAKKVGSPKKLACIVFGSGAIIGGGVVVGGIAIKNKVGTALDEKRKERETTDIHTVIADGQSNEGVEFKTGDKFKILEIDGEAVLIERLDDENNPYYISVDFLRSISDYEPEESSDINAELKETYSKE